MFDILAQATQPAAPVITGLDVVNQVDAFYNMAWGRLLWTVGIIGSILGILVIGVPWWISRLKERELKMREDEMKKRIDLLSSEVKIDLCNADNELREDMQIELSRSVADVLVGMAMGFYATDATEFLSISLLKSAAVYLGRIPKERSSIASSVWANAIGLMEDIACSAAMDWTNTQVSYVHKFIDLAETAEHPSSRIAIIHEIREAVPILQRQQGEEGRQQEPQ